jgi:hypothetical protein
MIGAFNLPTGCPFYQFTPEDSEIGNKLNIPSSTSFFTHLHFTFG